MWPWGLALDPRVAHGIVGCDGGGFQLGRAVFHCPGQCSKGVLDGKDLLAKVVRVRGMRGRGRFYGFKA